MLVSALTQYVNQLLVIEKYQDYAPNGLQVEGRNEVTRIASAVTADLNSIESAIAWGADALLVHHGYFWKGEPSNVVGMKKNRLRALLSNDINLLAYHLPLDCHKSLGNNAQLARILDIHVTHVHPVGNNPDLLWQGELSREVSVDDFYQLLECKLDSKIIHCGHDDSKSIKRLAWCSGGAQDFVEQASGLSVDAYLSGEISERTFYQAKELGIHYFAGGHHATERYGIQALGEYLAQNFHLTHRFFDSNNPI